MARYITTGTKSSFGAINTELEKIATAQEDFVSRVGETPNQMEADFDMNGNKLLNVPPPVDPTDVVRLKDISPLPSYNEAKSNYIDIRDFGAVPNDSSFDSSLALGLALTAANSVETVLIEGGVYYFDNVIINERCLLGGSATICPLSTYNNTLPLFTLGGDLSQIKDLTFDMLGTASYPLKVTSSKCIIKDLVVKNISATPDTSTSAAAVHLTGASASNNTVEGITVIDCINVNASNPSIPRCITIDGGASFNSILDISGYNIAAGLVHGTGLYNTLNGFTFDNNKPTDSEQRNGIYSLSGCQYFVSMNGVINHCAQPIVDQGLGNIYKDIIEINSGSDGVSGSTDATWDNITKVFTDNSPNGGFIRTRAENVVVNNLTIKNCRVVVPNHYTSIFTFAVGTLNNLRVEGNVFITENVDTVNFRNIVLHTAGENPQYIGNTFVLKNPETPYTTLQSWAIQFPSNATTGKWIRNSLESEATNGVIRATGILNKTGIAVDDQNQLRADFGTPYLQSGYTGRLLRGFIPPNSGAWNRGDTISNSAIDSTPLTGYDYQKYAFFICTESGDFSDNNNIPEFSLIGDSSTAPTFAQVVRPVITSPTEGQVINGTSTTIVASGFGGTGGQVHASTNWQVATDSSFSTLVFSSFNDTVNLLSINATGLPSPDTLYVRCLMTSTAGILSPHSATITFTTV